jgi:hypothetical protein
MSGRANKVFSRAVALAQSEANQRKREGETRALRMLPREARLLRAPLDGEGMCEFEVTAGNAAWREGEHFYLTPAQARTAYARPDETREAPATPA